MQFTFTKYPYNITINQTAVYRCRVDSESVFINWLVNGISSTSVNVTDLEIVTTVLSTSNSILSIPGNETLVNDSGIIVTCIASGLVNGGQYFNTSTAILYVKGLSNEMIHNSTIINIALF